MEAAKEPANSISNTIAQATKQCQNLLGCAVPLPCRVRRDDIWLLYFQRSHLADYELRLQFNLCLDFDSSFSVNSGKSELIMGCKRGIRIESSLQGKCESSVSLVLSICSNLHSSKPVHLLMCAKAVDGSLFSCSVTTISMSWRTLIHNPLEYRLNFYHQFDLIQSGRNPKKGMRYIAFDMESECSKTLR